ncbi:uncharacterized protein LOC121377086 [Gigantopelta aegis]|uniref:uncharacterized protein LOC121377086 n=1 Tax=Gigantopelta aegis TaxID=1735272 RepID=UPI001B889395|nr:uncharacterized protein LOC121377086 [Gigantopelta aegis]
MSTMTLADQTTSTSRLAMVSHIAGLMLQCTSLGMPYWKVFPAAGGNIFQGLWQTCSTSRLQGTDVFCEDSVLLANPVLLHVVRGLEVLGLALEVAAFVIILCYVTGCSNKRNLITCSTCCLLAATSVIVGSAIYGNTDAALFPGKLTWGYYLSFAGAAFCVLSGILFIVEHVRRRQGYTPIA